MVLFLRGGAQFSPRYFDDRELAYLAKYIIKRVAMGLLCIFIVATLTFLLMNLVPGGPFTAEKSMSKAAQEALAANTDWTSRSGSAISLICPISSRETWGRASDSEDEMSAT